MDSGGQNRLIKSFNEGASPWKVQTIIELGNFLPMHVKCVTSNQRKGIFALLEATHNGGKPRC